jgi:hypothetical protein
MMKWSLGQQNFLLLLFLVLLEGVYVKNLRGTFVENVKKSQKSTHPTAQQLG